MTDIIESQSIDDIKEFKDIKFNKREDQDMWYANIMDGDKRLLSIIYGKHALTGARHGKSNYSFKGDVKDDYGYEIMDSIGDDINPYQDFMGDDCYVVSKEELMYKLNLAKKYVFNKVSCCECGGAGYKIEKVKRKGNK